MNLLLYCDHKYNCVAESRGDWERSEDTLTLILNTLDSAQTGTDGHGKLNLGLEQPGPAKTSHLPPRPLTRTLHCTPGLVWSGLVWSIRLLAVHTKVWPGLFMYFYITAHCWRVQLKSKNWLQHWWCFQEDAERGSGGSATDSKYLLCVVVN